MIRHLPMLLVTVAPPAVILPAAWLLRPDPDWLLRHRPGSRPDMVPASAIVVDLRTQRDAGVLPASRFGPVQLEVPRRAYLTYLTRTSIEMGTYDLVVPAEGSDPR